MDLEFVLQQLSTIIPVVIGVILLGIFSIIMQGNYFIKRTLLFLTSLITLGFSITQLPNSGWWFLLMAPSAIAIGEAINGDFEKWDD